MADMYPARPENPAENLQHHNHELYSEMSPVIEKKSQLQHSRPTSLSTEAVNSATRTLKSFWRGHMAQEQPHNALSLTAPGPRFC